MKALGLRRGHGWPKEIKKLNGLNQCPHHEEIGSSLEEMKADRVGKFLV